MTELYHADEFAFRLRQMTCPHCAGSKMKVREIYANFTKDEIMVALATDPLRVIQLDEGGGEAWITLIVHCEPCDSDFDLYLRDGQIRFGEHADDARGIWGNLA